MIDFVKERNTVSCGKRGTPTPSKAEDFIYVLFRDEGMYQLIQKNM